MCCVHSYQPCTSVIFALRVVALLTHHPVFNSPLEQGALFPPLLLYLGGFVDLQSYCDYFCCVES